MHALAESELYMQCPPWKLRNHAHYKTIHIIALIPTVLLCMLKWQNTSLHDTLRSPGNMAIVGMTLVLELNTNA